MWKKEIIPKEKKLWKYREWEWWIPIELTLEYIDWDYEVLFHIPPYVERDFTRSFIERKSKEISFFRFFYLKMKYLFW